MTAAGASPLYQLRLFVAGNTTRSRRAIENLRALCAEHLPGQVSLEVVDIYQQPALAERHQIVAAPTLVKVRPFPMRRVVGDLSQPERVLRALDLPPGLGGARS